MKVSNIVNGVTALQKLNGLDLPISVALKIKRNIDKCQDVLTLFTDKRNEILKDLDIEEGAALPAESVVAINNHLEEEIDLELEMVTLSTLENADVKISVSDINNLEWMLENDL